MVEKLMVIGAGQMGSGIAQVAAQAGLKVFLYDINLDYILKGKQSIEKGLSRLVEKNKIELGKKEAILELILPSENLDDGANVDLVIEAVVENYETKCAIFKNLNRICSENVIFASNTSSISITALGKASGRSSRFIGMHFMNPVPIMKLVEIIKGLDTAEDVCKTIIGLCEKMNKVPVEANDYPGFALNRILIPMINEAIYAVYEGVAKIEDIDKIMTLGANQPMGPLALADLVGLDTCLSIMEILHQEFGDSKYRPCPLLRKYVHAGFLGKKSGQGFYSY